MHREIELFIAISALVVGLSHLLRPADWVEACRKLAGLGPSGAFINGAISLVPGTVIVAGHPIYSWPGAVLTLFGWLLVLKGSICLLAPEVGLRSMTRNPSVQGFQVGGVVLLIISAWVGCLRWLG